MLMVFVRVLADIERGRDSQADRQINHRPHRHERGQVQAPAAGDDAGVTE